ncbi:tetratricopeptide repeat protein [Flavobacterium psychrophilum]|uniref:tetratricopeptide repeat protein n=1 Tax=Flavobacterium psychrophilum TaxID=96345 RepID=UPI002B8B8A18|nr:hypothetical protein [Flavobacterium psychrophilum]
MKIKLFILLFVTNNIFCQISKETEKTLSYKQEAAGYIAKLKKEALINKRPEIGNFDVSVSFFEKVISNKLNINDFYRHVYKYIESYYDEKSYEYNELTGEHDLLVIEPKIILNFKGSKIVITLHSADNEENPIYYIKAGLVCSCDWFNIKTQAKNSGFSQYEYTDNPDKRNDIFGGLSIKYKKANYKIYYNKYKSKAYSEFTLSQDRPKAKKPSNSNEYLEYAKIRYKEGKVIEAIENINKALEMDKLNADAIFFRAEIAYDYIGARTEFTKGSQTWEAMEFLNKAIAVNDKSDKFFIKRGNLFDIIGQSDSAILDYKKAVEIDPTSANYYIFIDYLIKQNDFKTAKVEIDKLITKFPKSTQLLVRSAIVKYKTDDKCNAKQDLLKAKELGFNMSGRLDLIAILEYVC